MEPLFVALDTNAFAAVAFGDEGLKGFVGKEMLWIGCIQRAVGSPGVLKIQEVNLKKLFKERNGSLAMLWNIEGFKAQGTVLII